MGSRRGRGGGSAGRPARMTAETEARLRESDQGYVRQSRQRMKSQAIHTWIIRLVVLAVLGFVAYRWGPSLRDAVLFRGKTAVYRAQQAGGEVKRGTDERTGANFDPNP